MAFEEITKFDQINELFKKYVKNEDFFIETVGKNTVDLADLR